MALRRAAAWVCVLVHEHHRQQRVYWIAPGLLFEAIYFSEAIDSCVHHCVFFVFCFFTSILQQDL